MSPFRQFLLNRTFTGLSLLQLVPPTKVNTPVEDVASAVQAMPTLPPFIETARTQEHTDNG